MNKRLGRCYELAFNKIAILHPGHEGFLVHGVIRDTHLVGEGAVICHAWAEINDEIWEPITQKTLPFAVFMALYDATVIHRYTQRQAVEMALESGHSGPWAEMPDHLQVTLKRRGKHDSRRTGG